MAIKALAVGIFGLFGLFGLSESTCGKSSAEDASKEKPAASASGADVNVEGVDTSSLTPREKKDFGKIVSELLSPCQNVPVPIAQCVSEKRACTKCLPAAKFVLRGVKEGRTQQQIETDYKARFSSEAVKEVPLDGSPVKGAQNAPVTIVEFADFECPHCGLVAPQIDGVVEQHKNDVRFAFKFYPLPGHPHADIAARAAIAAWKQGKFWEMHHALFANQRHLEQTDLDSYAKELGLDVSRFHADMQSKETTDRIAQDKKLGEDLKIEGTPSIFINGRTFDGRQDMNEWIAAEIASGGAPAPAAAPTGIASDAGVHADADADAGAKKIAADAGAKK